VTVYTCVFVLVLVLVRMFAYVASGFENLWYAVCCLDVRGSVESRVGSRSNVCVRLCVCACVYAC
jgi:hypothetical protein